MVVRGWQRELSARVHAGADTCARQYGWTVTVTTGLFGFTARTYRDPRFDHRQEPARGPVQAGGRHCSEGGHGRVPGKYGPDTEGGT
jgi:hypothetical protein